jgi:ABC-2 type transport system permease protein
VTTLGIVASLMAASLRSELQYRANFVVRVLYGLIFQLTGFAFIGVVLGRFGEIGGWGVGDVAFLYGLRLLVHALRGLVFGNVDHVENLVRDGGFDRIMVRPLAPLLQVMAARIPISDTGNLLGGLGLFLAANALAGVAWTPPALLYLGLAIVGGGLVEAAIELACATLAFRLLSAQAFYVLLNDLNNTLGNYPFTIYGGVVRWALTFVLPIAFIAYLPATVLLGRTDELSVHPALAYAAPVIGVLLFMLAYWFWQHELRAYQSAGH